MAQHLDLRCVLFETPRTFGAAPPAETRLESVIKKCTPHCILLALFQALELPGVGMVVAADIGDPAGTCVNHK